MDTVVVALRVVLSLAVVLGLLWALQRRLSRGQSTRAANLVTVVGRQGLGQKASVVVLDVDGRRFVLGVTEQSINVLHEREVDGTDTTGALTAPSANDRSAVAFARSLHAASGGPSLVPPAPVTAPVTALNTALHTTGADAAATLAEPLSFRPRRDRGAGSRLGGSILSPTTWQQTVALLRHGR